MRVEYPIALDSDYAVWRAFGNHYWPAVYIADAEGRIRHHQFGEGGYDECETGHPAVAARGRRRRDQRRPRLGRPGGVRAAGRLGEPRDSPRPISATSRPRTSRLPAVQSATRLAPTTRRSSCARTSGRSPATGRSGRRRACWTRPGGRIVFRFHARDVHLVMAPRSARQHPFRSASSSTENLPVTRMGRRRRAGPRHAVRAAAPSADSRARADHRPHVRDQLRCSRGRGLLLHVRLALLRLLGLPRVDLLRSC